MDIADTAAKNFARHIRNNPYPGRGLVIGRAGDGYRFVYWIMGRSAHSRNRRFEREGGVLRTVPLDPSQVQDPSLIIYDAMLELPGVQLVSNGDQTRTVYEALERGETLEKSLEGREREPDAPNYTPRISGMLDLRGGHARIALSILKASPFDPADTDRTTFRPALPTTGYGLCLTTYMGDGQPLPSFVGDPLPLPLPGDAQETLEHYWNALDADNRISLAVKDISPEGQTRALLVTPE